MAQDEVVIRYVANVDGLKPLTAEVAKVTDLTKDLTAESKKVFADKTMDEAISKMGAYSNEVTNAVETQKSLTAQLKEMQKTLVTLDENSAEFARLSAEAGKLQDKIGDVRQEVRRLASDTRAIDGLVEGARGIAAAFSIAQGAAALFGSENKNLEKAILKTQAAMALLNGIQEIGQQLTQKNTLLNRAYAASIQFIEEAQQAFAVSSAAAWAAATAGISVLALGIATIVNLYGDAEDASMDFQAKQDEAARERARQLLAEKQEQLKGLSDADRAYFDEQERERKARIAAGEEQNNVEFDLLTKSIEKYQDKIKGYQQGYYDYLGLTYEEEKGRIKLFNDYINSAVIQRNSIMEAQAQKEKKALEDLDAARAKAFEADKARWLSIPKQVEDALKANEKFQKEILLEVDLLRINPKDVKLEKVPEVEVELTAKPIDAATRALKFLDPLVKQMEETQPLLQSMSTLTTSIFENETSALEREKNKQLELAGDNAEKRAKIEKDFAIKKAEIDRKAAATNKTFAIFDILLQTSKGIQKTIGELGFPAAIPFVALAAAAGAAQLAAVISRPLPEIPKFEKGGAVALAGGKIQGGMILGRRHRQGGVLIEAEGTEYIAKGAAVNKYGVDFFDAANNLELEPFLFKRYIAPALQQATKTIVEIDDEYLAQTFDKGAEKIVRAIHQTSKSNNDSAYFKSRYGNYGIA